MATGQWYTLIRVRDTPQQLTGVSQARTAWEALLQLEDWTLAYPADTTIVFDPDNRPVERPLLEAIALRTHPPPHLAGGA